MSRNIVHEGSPSDLMPYTNITGSAIAAGDIVVLKHCLGVALVNIATTAVGIVAIGGVIRDVVKTSGAAWLQGEKLQWDVSATKFAGSGATPATGDITGGAIAWLAAASSDVLGVIKLTPGNTTLT